MQKIMLSDSTVYDVQEIAKRQRINPKLNLLKNVVVFHIVGSTYQEVREKFSDSLNTNEIKVILDNGYEVQTYSGYTILVGLYENFEDNIIAVSMMESSTLEDEMKQMQENVSLMKNEIQSGKGIESYSDVLTLAKMQAQNLDDTQALSVKGLFGEWNGNGANYKAGYKLLYNGTLYKVLQEHISQDDWTPDVSPSLFTKVLIPDENVIPEWEQPNSTNPYMTGDKVTHNKKTWVSDVDNNVWEPGVYGWTEVGK